MKLTSSEHQKIRALANYNGDMLIGTNLKLYEKKQYKKLSLSGLWHFLTGTFNKKEVSDKIFNFLSSENVQNYLKTSPGIQNRVNHTAFLLGKKLRGKAVTALILDSLRHSKNLSQQNELVADLKSAYPEMKIKKKSLGKGAYSVAYLFTHTEAGQTVKKVLKFSEWSQAKKNPNAYKMDANRSGGEWLALLNYNSNIVETTAAIAYDEQAKKFVLISAEKFRELYANPALLAGKSYLLVGSVSRYAEGAEELHNYINNHKTIPDEKIRSILEQILTALEDMHKKGIMHRDIKPENVLIDQHGRVQLIDFGFAKRYIEPNKTYKRGHKRVHTACGTPPFATPYRTQMGKDVAYDEKEDLWALGVLAIELATGRSFAKDADQLHSYHAQLNRDQEGLETHPLLRRIKNQNLIDLIGQLGTFKSENRPSAEKALQHSFFQ